MPGVSPPFASQFRGPASLLLASLPEITLGGFGQCAVFCPLKVALTAELVRALAAQPEEPQQRHHGHVLLLLYVIPLFRFHSLKNQLTHGAVKGLVLLAPGRLKILRFRLLRGIAFYRCPQTQISGQRLDDSFHLRSVSFLPKR